MSADLGHYTRSVVRRLARRLERADAGGAVFVVVCGSRSRRQSVESALATELSVPHEIVSLRCRSTGDGALGLATQLVEREDERSAGPERAGAQRTRSDGDPEAALYLVEANWKPEMLRQLDEQHRVFTDHGLRAVLWLDKPSELEAMRRLAPRFWAFRSDATFLPALESLQPTARAIAAAARRLGESEVRLGQLRVTWEAAPLGGARRSHAAFELAQALIALGDDAQARDVLNQSPPPADAPAELRGHHGDLLAWTLLATGRTEQGLRHSQAAARLLPSPNQRRSPERALSDAGQVLEAQAVAELVVAFGGAPAFLHAASAAELYRERGLLGPAELLLQQVVADAPSELPERLRAIVQLGRADVLQAQGRCEDALLAMAQAWETQLGLPVPALSAQRTFELAELLARLGELELAEQLLEATLALPDPLPSGRGRLRCKLMGLRGRCLRAAGRPGEAKEAFQRAVSLPLPSDPGAHLDQQLEAALLLAEGLRKPEAAAERMTKAARAALRLGRYAQARTLRRHSELQELRRRDEEAILLRHQALARWPADARLQRAEEELALARLHLGRDRFQRALFHAQSAAEKGRSETSLWMAVRAGLLAARAHVGLGDSATALSSARHALGLALEERLAAAATEARCVLGRVLDGVERGDEAQLVLEAANSAAQEIGLLDLRAEVLVNQAASFLRRQQPSLARAALDAAAALPLLYTSRPDQARRRSRLEQALLAQES